MRLFTSLSTMPQEGAHCLASTERDQPRSLCQRHSLLHDALDFLMSFLHLR